MVIHNSGALTGDLYQMTNKASANNNSKINIPKIDSKNQDKEEEKNVIDSNIERMKAHDPESESRPGSIRTEERLPNDQVVNAQSLNIENVIAQAQEEVRAWRGQNYVFSKNEAAAIKALAGTADPQKAVSKYIASTALSQYTGIEANTIYTNLDAISQYYAGEDYTPYKLTLPNMIKNGITTVNAQKLMLDYQNAWMQGDTDKVAELETKIQEKLNSITPEGAIPMNLLQQASNYVFSNFGYLADAAMTGVSAGMLTSILAALLIPATGGLSTIAVPLTGGISATTGFVAKSLSTAASMGAQFQETANLASAQTFWDLMHSTEEEFRNPQLANTYAIINGVTTGLVETFMDGISSKFVGVFTGNQLKKIGIDALVNLNVSGGAKRLANGTLKYVAGSMDEGGNEFIESLSSSLVEALYARGVGDVENASMDGALKQAFTDAAAGILVGAVYGVPFVTAEMRATKDTAVALRSMANNTPSKAVFISDSQNLKPEDMSQEDFVTAQEQIWNASQEAKKQAYSRLYKDKVFETEEIAQEEAYIQLNSEGENTNIPDGTVSRTDSGRIYSESYEASPDRVQIRYGEDKNKIYGIVNLKMDKANNELIIDSVRTSLGYEGIRQEMIAQAISDYRTDENVVWNPTTKGHIAVKEALINANPKGKEFGLNYSSTPNDTALANVAASIQSNIKNTTREEAIVAAKFYSLSHPTGGVIFGNASDMGDKLIGMRGATDKATGLIYASEHADVSTFMHELFHSTVDSKPTEKIALSQAIKSTIADEKELGNLKSFITDNATIWGNDFNIDKVITSLSSIDDSKWTIPQEENITRLYEAYRASSKSVRQSLPQKVKAILEKIAEAIKSVYQTLAGTVKLNDKIAKAFDDLTIGSELNNENTVSTTTENTSTVVYQEDNLSEYDRIRAKYINTDKWLKAPNGEPTNLTEEQWITVRTNAFKKWFGDWTTRLINTSTEEIRQIIIDIVNSNDVIQGISVPFDVSADTNDIRRNVRTETKGLRKEYTNNETGIKVSFSSSSLNDLLRHDYKNPEHIASIFAIPEFIQKGRVIAKVVDADGREFTYLLNKYEFENKEYLVRSSIYHKNNILYYDHKLSSVEKFKDFLEDSARLTSPGFSIESPSIIEDNRLLSLMQGFSKVLDKNGEPLVVYHGSSKWFNEFSMEAQHQSNAPDGTIFTTDNREIANSYIAGNWYGESAGVKSKQASDVILDEHSPLHENMPWGIYRKGGIYPLFMNLKNPLIVDFKGQSALSADKNINTITQDAKAQGYDGVIASNIKDVGSTDLKQEEIPIATDYVAFNSNQVKSATDNNGDFSAEEDSILFQEAYHGSPHRFSKFDTSAIGTGAGAQAFGWGIYASADEVIAKGYSDLGQTKEEKEQVVNQLKAELEKQELQLNKAQKAYDLYNTNKKEYLKTDETYQNYLKSEYIAELRKEDLFLSHLNDRKYGDNWAEGYAEELERKLKEQLRSVKARTKNIQSALEKAMNSPAEGHNLYTVEIPDDNFLQWDKKVSASKLKTILNKINEFDKQKYPEEWDETFAISNKDEFEYITTGGALYNQLAAHLGSDKEASKFLSEIGYKGIRYKAETNIKLPEGADPNAYNYVIFNDKYINILNHLMYQDDIENWEDAFAYVDAESNMQAPFYDESILDEFNADYEGLTEEDEFIWDNSTADVDAEDSNPEDEVDITPKSTKKKIEKKASYKMSEVIDSNFFDSNSLDFTYEEMLSELVPDITYSGTDAQKDRTFINSLKDLESFSRYMTILGESVLLNTSKRNRVSQWEIDPYQDQTFRENMQAKVLARIKDVTILRLARDLSLNKDVSFERIQKVQKTMLQNPRIWRDFFAVITGNTSMKPKKLIDSKKLSIPEEAETFMTQDELIKLATEAKATEVADKLTKGTLQLKDIDITMLEELGNVIKNLNDTISNDFKRADKYQKQVEDLTAKLDALTETKERTQKNLNTIEAMITDSNHIMGLDDFDKDGDYKKLLKEREDLTKGYDYFLKISTPEDKRKHTPELMATYRNKAETLWMDDTLSKYNYTIPETNKGVRAKEKDFRAFVDNRVKEIDELLTELQSDYVKRLSLQLYLKTAEVHESATEFKQSVDKKETALNEALTSILEGCKKVVNKNLKPLLSDIGLELTDKAIQAMSTKELANKIAQSNANKLETAKKRIDYRKQKNKDIRATARNEFKQEIKDLKTKLAIAATVANSKTNALRVSKKRINYWKQKVEKTRAEYQDKRQQESLIKAIREEKIKLGNIIMKKVSLTTTDWETAGQFITAIQDSVDDNFRRDWAKYIPDAEQRTMTKEQAVAYLNSLSEKERNEILSHLSARVIERLYNGKKSLNEFTLEELRTLANDVQALKEKGRDVLAAKERFRQLQSRQSIKDILEALRPLSDKMPTNLTGSVEKDKDSKSLKKKVQAGLYASWRMQELAQLLDGGAGRKGTAYSLLVDEKRYHQEKTKDAIDARLKIVESLKDDKELKEAMFSSYTLNLGDIVQTFDAMDLAYVYLSQFNEDNKAAVAFGNLLTEEEKGTVMPGTSQKMKDENGEEYLKWEYLSPGSIVDDNVLKNIGLTRYNKLLKEATTILDAQGLMPLVEAIGKDFSSQTDKLSQMVAEVYNTPFTAVDSYLPIQRQALNGEDLYQEFGDSMFNTNTNGVLHNPEKGWTIERIKISPRHQKPVNLNLLQVWEKAVTQQETLYENAAYIKKLHSVIKNPELLAMIEKVYGNSLVRELEDYIDLLANPQKGQPKTNTDKLLRLLRGNLGAAYLGFKTSGIILQSLTSWAPFMTEVNISRLFTTYLQMATNPKELLDFVFEKSSMMRHRSMNQIYQELLEIASQINDSKVQKRLMQFLKIGMAGLAMVDKIAVSGGWLAKYNQVLEAKIKAGVPTFEADIAAIKAADDLVLKVQPTGDITEMASMFRGKSEALKAILQFQSSLNVIWNNITFDAKGYINNKDWKSLVGAITGYAIAGILVGTVMTGFDEDDTDGEKAGKIAYWAFSQFLDSTPFVSSTVNGIAEKVMTGKSSYRGSGSLFPAFDYFQQAVNSASNKDFGEVISKTFYGVGLLTGLPVSGIKQILKVSEEGAGALVGR